MPTLYRQQEPESPQTSARTERLPRSDMDAVAAFSVPSSRLPRMVLALLAFFGLVLASCGGGEVVSIDQPDELPMAELIASTDRQGQPLVTIEWELVGSWELVDQDKGLRPVLVDAVGAMCDFLADMTVECSNADGDALIPGLWLVDPEWGSNGQEGKLVWSRLPRVERTSMSLLDGRLEFDGGVWERTGDLARAVTSPALAERPLYALAIDGTWRVEQSQIARFAQGDRCTFSKDLSFDCVSVDSPWRGEWSVSRFNSFGLSLIMSPHNFEMGFIQASDTSLVITLDGESATLSRQAG